MRYQSLHKGTLHPTEHSLPHAIDLLVLTHTLNTKHPIKGKCLECDVEDGFAVQASLTGSLVGHIALGTLIVSTTLLEITQADKTLLAGRSFEEVRAHILHVILAHHGTNEHGSPVEPQTLEALIVHSLDTLDAHAEIMRAAWLAADPNANLIDAPRPLKGKLARSLKRSAADG
jgi:3'-5' exoribonuclease